jgi:hypothetical protein
MRLKIVMNKVIYTKVSKIYVLTLLEPEFVGLMGNDKEVFVGDTFVRLF